MGIQVEQIVEAVTNPKVAVPVASVGPVSNVFDLVMPHIVTIGWLAYIALLAGHTAWKWRRDWLAEKDRRAANG